MGSGDSGALKVAWPYQTENYRILLANLQDALARSDLVLIGIEGQMCAGKSSLAKQLASDVRDALPPLHVDDFRPDPVPDLPYLKTLNLPLLAEQLDERLRDFPTRPSVIEGICLREVLGAIGRKLDLAIYVKRLSPSGLWHTQFDLEDFENDPRPNVPKVLYLDELRYHNAYRPHETADLEFKWTDV